MSDPKEFLEIKGFLTIHMLEDYLKKYHPLRAVTYPTLRRYVEKGYFNPVQIGGQYRIPKDQIDRYTEQGTAPKVDTKSPLFDTGGGSTDPLPPNITKEPSNLRGLPTYANEEFDPDADVDPEPTPPSTLKVPPIPTRQPVRPNVPLPPEDDENE